MKDDIQSIVASATGADRVLARSQVQELWSGYGSIARYETQGGHFDTVIVKHVHPPVAASHPRGWNTNSSHQRKLKSYQVEAVWYRRYAGSCHESCRVPRVLAVESSHDEVVFVLEDLDAAGFAGRRSRVGTAELKACLSWLASFHATFLGETTEGLWPVGTYWHLETRPDELQELTKEDPELAQAAAAIDFKLREASFQTLVHGDAKLANFCFCEEDNFVAAVDFQYVGGGCGMKDVAYFLGSCLNEDACREGEEELLAFYFDALKQALLARGKRVDFAALEMEWRSLYPFAWTDFHRFLKGWNPGHWKINGYSECLAREVVAAIRESEPCN